jgi:hypothetical protein
MGGDGRARFKRYGNTNEIAPRLSLHGYDDTSPSAKTDGGWQSGLCLRYCGSVPCRSGFGSEVGNLVDGVNGLFFAGAATQDEHTRDEMEGAVVAFLAALRGRFLAHYQAGDTYGFAAVVALDAAEIRFCCSIGTG